MGRGKLKAATMRWCSLIASFAFLTVANGATPKGAQTLKDPAAEASRVFTDPVSCQDKSCGHKPTSRSLMLVSTLDGKMSALNLDKDGALEWSIETGEGDLLSSSISKLEVNRNGVITRLIPSLDGGLYQFDGESVQPVPFNADTLLSSSFRFNDDSTIVGGKHAHSYGIDAQTGQICYVCTSEGCQQVAGNDDPGSIFVVTRYSKMVRAVELRTGVEKWNFSVGEHEVAYVAESKRAPPQTGALTDESREVPEHDCSADGEEQEEEEQQDEVFEEEEEEEEMVMDDDEDVTVCSPDDEAGGNKYTDFQFWNESEEEGEEKEEIELKVIVPSGLVIAVSKKDGKTLWQYKFDTPIAKAWTLRDGRMDSMDLFDAKIVPALSFEGGSMDGAPPPSPAVYIGLHQKQIYVQPSVQMMQHYEESLVAASGQLAHLVMPKISWNPYLASAKSRTPAAIEFSNPMQITWETDRAHFTDDETRLSVLHQEYPYDPGYYLFYERGAIPLSNADRPTDPKPESYFDSAVYWLKEMWVTVALSGLALNMLYYLIHSILGYFRTKPALGVIPEQENVVIGEEVKVEEVIELPKPIEFESRYVSEFEQVMCLGKGGFGVVYEARNRLDDCAYAVKRIPLRNSESARSRVRREVTALAKLDHPGIVRYFNAWIESPPPGWQEQKDEEMMANMEGLSNLDSGASDPPTVGSYSKAEESMSVSHRKKEKLVTQPSAFNPFKPFDVDLLSTSDSKGDSKGDTEESSDWTNSYRFGGGEGDTVDETQSMHIGESFGFVPRGTDSARLEDSEDSDSLSTGHEPNQSSFVPRDNSFAIDFQDESEASGSQRQSDEAKAIPFKKYSATSQAESQDYSIVFEDSGSMNQDNDANANYDSTEMSASASHSQQLTSGHSTHSAHPGLSQLPTRPRTLDVIPENATPLSPEPPVSKSYLYIQMQLCQKASLKEWLAGNTLNRSREQSLDIFEQIVSAVDYVHACGLMHRDLKPSNIFFSLDNIVKIGDFGLATEDGRSDGVVTPMNNSCQPHTNQVGTKLYMSPEQIAGKQYTNKVDIYALGLILFELRYPFATMMERGDIMASVKKLNFPQRFQKELPEECSLVESLLSPVPDQRPTTTEILEMPMMIEAHQQRLEKRKRTSSRNRTISTNSSHSNSTSMNEDTDSVVRFSSS